MTDHVDMDEFLKNTERCEADQNMHFSEYSIPSYWQEDNE